jgi:pilus assembly protein CpaF
MEGTMSPFFGRKVEVVAPSPPPPPPAAPQPLPAARPASRSLTEVRTQVLARIDPAAVADMPPETLRPLVEKLIDEIATASRSQLNGREQAMLATELVHDMVGLGPLEPLLADDSVTDIMVNGPARTFAERSGKLVEVPVRFRDAGHLLNVAQRIASAVGRRVDEASPMVDARLADGSRVNIVVPPLAIDGACISIRKFARRTIGFRDLIEYKSLSEPLARALEILGRCRLNIIISGGTGSGKTTLLNAISRMISPAERVITIEDAAELQLQQPHVVRLETRMPNLEGSGQVTQRDLVRNALRMRPDRIIIGEVRGAEAFDMLQAMNTGHDGSMSTVHANNPRDALARIENMVLMAGMSLPSRAIRQQVAGAVNVIIQIQRMRDGVRRITHLTELVGMEGEVILTQDLFTFEFRGENRDGLIEGRHLATGLRPRFIDRLAHFGQEAAWTAATAP